MLLKNSLKQMKRIKAKTFTFLFLMILTGAFLSIGVNLWLTCNENLKKYERVFKTIGVVNQKENTIEVTEHWDSSTKKYTYWDKPVYDSILPDSLLDFEGANYIIKPKQRPYYGSYCPDLKIWPLDLEEGLIRQAGSILEFVPYDDCIPANPVKVKVTKVIWGTSRKEGEDIWFCDQFNANPGLLKAGKTYVTAAISFSNPFDELGSEFLPYATPSNPTISTHKGNMSENVSEVKSRPFENWAEVTGNFYETKEGQKWKAVVKGYDHFFESTIPVVPTSKTYLLLDFYKGDVSIIHGRDIKDNEYEKGEKVCILPQELASRNNLNIGDSIHLQLYFSNYENSSSQNYLPSGSLVLDFGLLDEKQKAYPVFENSNYEIVGIYSGTDKTNYLTGYEMGYNAVIIPSNSVTNSDADSIVAYGPMKSYTTSFQIPNGTRKEYLEKFQALGIKNLKINFYDGGYEKLASGMRNLRIVAIILMAVSSATTLAVLFFFLFLFITKQKKRTAIERSLGMNKKSCILSLLYGILCIISLGEIIGSFAGYTITRVIISKSTRTGTERYSTEFSSWVNNSDKAAPLNATSETVNLITPIILCIVVIFVSLIIAVIFIKNNLNSEPLILLGKNEE
ncbi:MAG: ABC transporter permease [Lachnospiraceae bacterium]|jgi:hypothetical protein|nr:ABC transporter permease [Lachnospiraceae bacterium]